MPQCQSQAQVFGVLVFCKAIQRVDTPGNIAVNKKETHTFYSIVLMNKSRITYFIAICIVVALGFASRQFSIIPFFTGDVLWALMIFLIFRFLFINITAKSLVLLSLSFCFLIEISQLYQAEWINNIRHTTLGGLILGQGFLWSDIIAYTAGVIIGALFENVLRP